MSKNKQKNLSWEAFQSMGNPENAPKEKEEPAQNEDHFIAKSTIRIHLEKKGRGGKAVSIIRGLEMTNSKMKELEKQLKSHCGVGGSQKNNEIILQGDHRDKIIAFLKKQGAKDIKKAGA